MENSIGESQLVIGLGSGRSGTASLASLIDRQAGGLCFHEMNPSASVFSGNPQQALNTISELNAILAGGPRNQLSIDYSRPMSVVTYERLQELPELRVVGDIASYYLTYVGDILQHFPECKFVCVKRDREQTVASWLNKTSLQRWPSLRFADRIKSIITRTPYYTSLNHWQDHDGSEWSKDPVWDSCFPKFEASSKEEAIRSYWDYYYEEAERLAKLYSTNFRVFQISDLDTREGQESILTFIGIPLAKIVGGESVHIHKS